MRDGGDGSGAPWPPPPIPRGERGFWHCTWREPGDWRKGAQLRYHGEGIGTDPPDGTLILVVHYEPGCVVDAHYHGADYCSIVVEGSLKVAGVEHRVGSMRFVRAGTVYGPLVAGPEGATVIDVFAVGSDPLRAANTYVGRTDKGVSEGPKEQ
ncbi:MAG: hypothetical protein KatS3mg124_1321 [Porticoccaceae bacterium]|nr:MAG: hypothetical protein KatS3mg124_1321 [Porticoccaceae bacterium]